MIDKNLVDDNLLVGEERRVVMEKPIQAFAIFAFVFAVVLLLGAYLMPWRSVNWGKMEMTPSSVISVTGEAQSQQKNQVANFTAGVSAVNDSKEKAVAEVNANVAEIIKAVKDFGIPDQDIKTQNINVYQGEETFYEEGRQKSEPGQWRVHNSIEITLRDVARASMLVDLLTKSGATNVYGPNFTIEEAQDFETALLGDAIEVAREKAEVIAKASGRKLGEVINVTEGQATPVIRPMFETMGLGGGTPLEPGSSAISKTVTVTFELK